MAEDDPFAHIGRTQDDPFAHIGAPSPQQRIALDIGLCAKLFNDLSIDRYPARNNQFLRMPA